MAVCESRLPGRAEAGQVTMPGVGRRFLVGLISVVAVCGLPDGGGAQSIFVDSYWVDGIQVPVDIYADSFAIVTTVPLTAQEAAGIVGTELTGAVGIRTLSPLVWLLRVDQLSRADLAAAVLALDAHPQVRQAGFVLRTPEAEEPALVTHEFLVQFVPGTRPSVIDQITQQTEVVIAQGPTLWPDHYVMRVTAASGRDALRMANYYQGLAPVAFAHPNFVLHDQPAASWSPTDPDFPKQWHLYNPGAFFNGIRADIHAPEAWDLEKGDPDIVIGIVERNGFESTHPDLAANLWQNPWLPGQGPYPGLNGVNGWNFQGCPSFFDPVLQPCGSPDLTYGASSLVHGTQVAGVAGAVADNGTGGVGVCLGCRLMLIRVSLGVSSFVRAVALQYASDMGSDVLNLSFNTKYNETTLIQTVQDIAVNSRGGLGTTIVAAAPEFTFDKDFCSLPTPVLAASPYVISVLDSNDEDMRSGGAMGPCLALVAPGVKILTTTPVDTYTATDGTSFAAPVVAGVAGLLLSADDQLSRQEIYDILTGTADKVGPVAYVMGRNDMYGYGRVNAHRALQQTGPSESTPDPEPTRWEVGIRTGIVSLREETGGTDYVVALPGNGPLGEAAVYATWFHPSIPLSADLQVGYANTWGNGSAPNRAQLVLAALLALEMSLGSSKIYVGPSVATRRLTQTGVTTVRWGYGGALGYRHSLGSKLNFRVETLGRSWSALMLDEVAFAIGVGVRLP